MKVLYLNTAGEIVKLGIVEENHGSFVEFESDRNLFEILLSKIDKLLKENKIKKEEITHIAVFEGPGRFTSLRIGVVTANTISYGLKIPLMKISQKDEENLEESIFSKIKKKDFLKQVVPSYGKEPNITKSKKS